MEHGQFFRFRLLHLFLAVFVVCAVLWAVTQKGVQTAEIEILTYSTELETDRYGTTVEKVTTIEFVYLNPQNRRHLTLHLFLTPTFAEKTFEVGTCLSFEYREKPLFWLKPSNPDDIAIAMLKIDKASIEEVITASGDSIE